MLTRLGPSPSSVTARDAGDALPFCAGLEFNPPAHGTWNIVHIGMLVPQAHQVYVCALNCMRGVVLTAAEMGAQDRFSCVVLREEDIVRGDVGRITHEGIADALHKLEARGSLPPCVEVFPVCTHLFLGVHMAPIYKELEREFPGVDFVRAFMDPISRKRLVPDQRLRKVMYDPLPPCEPDGSLVALLGSDLALDADSDLRALLAAGGRSLCSAHDCGSYGEFLGLARAATMVSVYPGGAWGARMTAHRLGRRHLHLPMSMSLDQIEQEERCLCHALGLPLPDFSAEREACELELGLTRDALGAMPVALDALAHPRPLGLARLLVEHGMCVTEAFVDVVADGAEREALAWLSTHAPDLRLSPMVSPTMRVAVRTRPVPTLAIGQRAAWFTGTPHFVNVVQGGGMWGFAGVRTLARLMRDAAATEQDAADVIPRKGLGCPSCF